MKCKIKGMAINYEIIGEGKPILMIHGYAADHILMSSCMEPIFNDKDNYKRIYIDLPGMGESEIAEWVNCSDRMLEVLIEFIEKVIPNDNFLIAGQSYGGYLSRGVVLKMASRIDGLLLICPCIIADRKKRDLPPKVVLEQDTNLLARLSQSDAEHFNSAMVIQNEETYRRYRDEILSGIKKSDINFLRNFIRNGYSFSFDVDNIKNKFDKPTLIILGRQDSGVGYKDAWNILENFTRVTFAVLDRAGHNLQIEQEKLFNSLVYEWLTRGEKM